MPTPSLDPSKADSIRKLLARGLTHREIADVLSVAVGTVSKVKTAAPAVRESFSEFEAPEPKWDAARKALFKQHCRVADLARIAGADEATVLEWLEVEHRGGLNLLRFNDAFFATQSLAVGGAGPIQIVSRPNNTFSFGCSTDQHLGSKYSRLDVLDKLYDRFAAEGVQAVLNCGNWIDGEARFNVHDLLVHGLDAQLDYLVEHYPQRDGITTYAVSGDDHEGWYAKSQGIDVGRMAQRRFEDAGRDDFRHIGFIQGEIELVNFHSGESSRCMLMHPGGGSAYALSYTSQKIVESFAGGEKPAILLTGHYHKQEFARIRNVYAIQCGTTQDQTPFMRKKRLEAHVGGVFLEAKQDPKTGAIEACKVELIGYFDKGYYTPNRWSYAGPVNHPVRA